MTELEELEDQCQQYREVLEKIMNIAQEKILGTSTYANFRRIVVSRVTELTTAGLSERQIAKELGLSHSTVNRMRKEGLM